MQTLKEISSGIAGVVEQAGPSVVRIEAGRRFPGGGIVWAADGTIVTADHVIEQEDDIRVGLPDGQLVAATLAGRDPGTDLAVVRAQTSGLSVPSWSDAAAKVGQLVIALARPGRTVRARVGLIGVSVEPGSPAGRGGVVLGDVIVAVNGTSVRTHDDVAAQLTSEKVGASLRIRLVRGGAVKELSVTVVER